MKTKMDNFSKYQDYTYSQWQKSILLFSLIIAFIVLGIEILTYFMLSKTTPKEQMGFFYIIIRIVVPSAINFGYQFFSNLLIRNKKISVSAKNYIATFSLFIDCAIIAIFHNYFNILLVCPIYALFMASIFGDKKLLHVMGIATVPVMIISGIVFWLDPFTGDPIYRIMIFICTVTLITSSFLFSNAILNTQTKHLDYIHNFYQRQSNLIEELKIDPLSRLYNRASLKETLLSIIARAKRETIKPFIAILDIDSLKKINDKYGLTHGDDAVVALSGIIKSNMGTFRKAFRFGGEEFVLLFDDSFPSQSIYTVESIRVDFENKRFDFASDECFTISAGIAALNKNDDPTLWLDRAEKALAVAKKKGKNQIHLSEEF